MSLIIVYKLCTEDMWKVTARSHGGLAENTLRIADGILYVAILCYNILLVFGLIISDICGKFKPKLVQKSFLRKSQDLHLDAVPTTYAQRSLRKRGSHTQALRFGAAQPFWTLSQRCCSNKKHTNQSKTNKQDKQDGLNHVTVSDYFFAVSLALSQKQPYSLTATIV